jgi:hypothetical protein
MTSANRLRDKLRKLEALRADASATDGERAAAAAAADRIAAKWPQPRKKAPPSNVFMYRLGRACRWLLSKR